MNPGAERETRHRRPGSRHMCLSHRPCMPRSRSGFSPCSSRRIQPVPADPVARPPVSPSSAPADSYCCFCLIGSEQQQLARVLTAPRHRLARCCTQVDPRAQAVAAQASAKYSHVTIGQDLRVRAAPSHLVAGNGTPGTEAFEPRHFSCRRKSSPGLFRHGIPCIPTSNKGVHVQFRQVRDMSSAACRIVRTHSTTSVRLLHGGILLPSGISDAGTG
ncbi:uncharacterized protein LOC123446462 [Hordeum vulgare subsp. vulgare]|uniref:Predicted protein n=1 Tax=Hordeum vulgare subsp. vulgare TaxID=112509 RepID=F2E540_HORVV|nr:uncharacterized protein LOC123446462 [Hordeum vulgare subsp. vulgare]BAK02462.1 predicted protein [Hordeum vulgare subsp. vulgare]